MNITILFTFHSVIRIASPTNDHSFLIHHLQLSPIQLFFSSKWWTITQYFTSNILLSLTTFFPWHFLHLSFGLSTSPEKLLIEQQEQSLYRSNQNITYHLHECISFLLLNPSHTINLNSKVHLIKEWIQIDQIIHN